MPVCLFLREPTATGFGRLRRWMPGGCMWLGCVMSCSAWTGGEIVWRVDFVRETGAPVPAFGFVASPLVDEDWVYVQARGFTGEVGQAHGRDRLADAAG
jgi:hypothetical protein